VDVIFNIVGHVEVDDNADVLHVQPSGSHVSRYKHWEAALLEFSQGRVSLLLGLITVNATSRVSLTLNGKIEKKTKMSEEMIESFSVFISIEGRGAMHL
jgi:hypothetical protein